MRLLNRNLPIEQLNEANHLWTIAKGKDNNVPFLLRFNGSAKEWRRHPDLSIRLGIAIPLNKPSPGKMPDPAENIELIEIEDIICDFVKRTGPAIHIATITNGEMKEFIYYIKNGDAVATLHRELIERITSHKIQCYAKDDKDWIVYDSLEPK